MDGDARSGSSEGSRGRRSAIAGATRGPIPGDTPDDPVGPTRGRCCCQSRRRGCRRDRARVSIGEPNAASMAGSAVTGMPACPVPTIVVMTPEASTLRMRWLPASPSRRCLRRLRRHRRPRRQLAPWRRSSVAREARDARTREGADDAGWVDGGEAVRSSKYRSPCGPTASSVAVDLSVHGWPIVAGRAAVPVPATVVMMPRASTFQMRCARISDDRGCRPSRRRGPSGP